MNRIDVLNYAADFILKADSEGEQTDIKEARAQGHFLMEYLCGITKNDIFLKGDAEVSSKDFALLETALKKRAKGVPVQYICQNAPFMGLDFYVNENVLIPRFDTEILVEEVLRLGQGYMRILDMCTGSGCILLSILKYSLECTGVGIDISPKALEVAQKNAEKLNIEAEFLQSDMFSGLDKNEKFDLIVSNPPYIRTGDIGSLMGLVKDGEPRLALDGKEDGLFFYRIISREASGFLNNEGRLFLEIGYDQAEEVVSLLKKDGYRDIEVFKDLGGRDRVVAAVV